MARVEAETLRAPEAIALARSLRQAQTIEQRLTEAGVDYAVEVEAYGRSFLFGTVRHGAVFYTSGAQAAYCRADLEAAGFADAVVDGS